MIITFKEHTMNHPDFYQGIPQDILCTHTIDCADVAVPFHQHDQYEIYLLSNGKIDFYLEQQGFRMTKGSGLFIAPGVFHGSEHPMHGIYDTCNIHIKYTYFRTLNSLQTDLAKVLYQSADTPFFQFQLTEEQMQYFLGKSHELEKSLCRKNFGDDILSECLLKEILLFLNRFSPTRKSSRATALKVPALTASLISYIRENLTGDLSMDTLSEVSHYNGQYISRCFKETTGISLQQYIIQKRLDIAKKYLAEGYPLTQVCHSSGFHDYTNFSKTFTRYTGMSPKQYQMENMLRW